MDINAIHRIIFAVLFPGAVIWFPILLPVVRAAHGWYLKRKAS